MPSPTSAPPLADAPQTVPSLRTLGTGHTQAAPGDDSRLGTPSDATTTPTANKIPKALGTGVIDPGWLAALSGTAGAVLLEVEPGSTVVFRQLSEDDVLAGFTISTFALAAPTISVVEVGDTVTDAHFTASYNRSAAAVTINDAINGAQTVTLPATTFQYGAGGIPSESYTKTTINATVVFTLSANEAGGPVKTKTLTITWEPRAYYGVAVPPGSYNQAFITGLSTSALESVFARTIAYAAGNNTKKLYYCFPHSLGTPTSFIDQSTGFSVPFTKIASAVSVTNSFGITFSGATGYDVWESDNYLDAAVTIKIS